MGLNYFTNAEMVETTDRWVGAERARFLSIAEIAGLMPKVEAVHANLLNLVKDASEPAAVAVAHEVLDDRQDRYMRALYYMHRAYREYLLAQDEFDNVELQRVKVSQKALLPRGMTGSRVGYVEEAGNAKLAKEAFDRTPEAKIVVGKLRLTSSVTGQQVLDGWQNAAAALGKAVQDKNSQVNDSERGLKALQARSAWISVVRAVLAVLDHSTGSAADVAAIRGPVEALEEKSTARVSAKLKAQPSGPTAPTA
jgi:hypothetical protein